MTASALSVLLNAAVVADTVYVNGDCGDDAWTGASPLCAQPDGPKRTIQAGIDAAISGDTVEVADGVYTGDGNRDIDFGGSSILLRSEGGRDNCVIDCQATRADPHRGFYFHSGESAEAVVQGFTIRNGYVTRNSPGGANGGGLYCLGSSPTIIDCALSRNTVESISGTLAGGGGMYNESSNPTVIQCTFERNIFDGDQTTLSGGGGMLNRSSDTAIIDCTFTANTTSEAKGTGQFGGGMLNIGGSPSVIGCTFRDNLTDPNESGGKGAGMANFGASLTLAHCTFVGNTASNNGIGGGMYNESSSLVVTDCVFSENTAEIFGGGIFIGASSSAVLVDCTFISNHVPGRPPAAAVGGAIVNAGGGDLTLTRCVFIGNTCFNIGASGGGGAISNFDGHLAVDNCTLIGNHALGETVGGAIENRRGATATIANSTFAENTAVTGGGIWNNATMTVTSSVLWGNTPEQAQSFGSLVVTFSDVQGGFPGKGNIDANPLFVDPDNGDYHLSDGSPCIDLGDPDFVAQPGETDVDGQKRVWNGRVDMGSDEFGSFAFGDMNCDQRFDAFDIEAFLLALFDPDEYAIRFPNCDVELADLNFDGVVDAFDIEPFLDLLFP